MALGPTHSLVFLQRKALGRLNPPVRWERPPDTRSGRQSTMIPAVSRATTPGGLDTLLERRYAVELHAAFGGCGPKDAHLAASLGNRGGSIAQRSLQRPLESDGYDVTVRRMRPQALSCFATLPPLQSSWSFIVPRQRGVTSRPWCVDPRVRRRGTPSLPMTGMWTSATCI
jgi:hypothetical protein